MLKKINFVFVCITGLFVISSGCKKNDKNAEDTTSASITHEKNTLVYNLGEDLNTFDPQLVSSETEINVAYICFEGLTRLGRKPGEILPGIAEKWETSEDGKTWTFYLRKNAKWSNGDIITANDFRFAWERALSPETCSRYSIFLFPIKNAQYYVLRKIRDFSEVGIEAVDNYTLRISLDMPCVYFPQLTALPVTYPLNRKFYNAVRDRYATNVEDTLYNGPWKVISDQKGELLLEKNQYYWNKDNIKLDSIKFITDKDDDAISDMITNKQIDVTRISTSQLVKFRNEPNYRNNILGIPDGGVWYLDFNLTNKYFKNEKIRTAFALAIDRKTLCEKVEADGSRPAYAIVPYGTSGGEGITFRERYGEACFNEDVVLARQLLTEGLKELGLQQERVKVKLLFSSEFDTKVCLFLQEELRRNLDVDVILDLTTFQNKIQRKAQKDFDFTYAHWGPDYNDPMTFLDLFTSWNSNNYTSWSSKEYDTLIEDAGMAVNNEIRMETLHNAEKLLMEEMPITPLMFKFKNFLIQPAIKDMVFGLGAQPLFDWAYILNRLEN